MGVYTSIWVVPQRLSKAFVPVVLLRQKPFLFVQSKYHKLKTLLFERGHSYEKNSAQTVLNRRADAQTMV